MIKDTTVFPISIGARCINKEWFGMPMNEVWEIMSDYLHFISHAYEIQIHLFVLMSNHYHMIARAPLHNLALAMQYLQGQTSRQIGKPVDRINHIWRAKYFRSLINNPLYYLHAYKYFYRNPVAAGLCERVEDYHYSTLHGLLGQSKLIIPVCHDDTLFNDVAGTLDWLNLKPSAENQDAVRRALRRNEFKLPRFNNGHAHPLEKMPF